MKLVEGKPMVNLDFLKDPKLIGVGVVLTLFGFVSSKVKENRRRQRDDNDAQMAKNLIVEIEDGAWSESGRLLNYYIEAWGVEDFVRLMDWGVINTKCHRYLRDIEV